MGMNYLKIFIILLIFWINPVFSFDNFDECGLLEKVLKEKQFELSLDEINYTKSNYFGIRIRYDGHFEEPNIVKVHPLIKFKNQVADEKEKLLGYDLEALFITEINGKKTISLNEEDFFKEFDKNIISIKVENDPKVYQLEKQLYENLEIYFTGDIKNISSFDNDILQGDLGKFGLYEGEEVPLDFPLIEEEKDVELNKPKRGGSKKYYVYVRNDKGNIIKVEFGDTTGLSAKINDPEARKSFVARHKCHEKKDKTKAGYWACRLPRYAKALGLKGGGNFFW